MTFEEEFIDKITQVVKIGPDIKENDPLYGRAKEYIFGFVPVDSKEGGAEELIESMITSMVHVIRADLDSIIGKGIPRTPSQVYERTQEYKHWRIRFALRPRIHKYTAKAQKHGQHWLNSQKISNDWEETARMEGRWLYQRSDTPWNINEGPGQ